MLNSVHWFIIILFVYSRGMDINGHKFEHEMTDTDYAATITAPSPDMFDSAMYNNGFEERIYDDVPSTSFYWINQCYNDLKHDNLSIIIMIIGLVFPSAFRTPECKK